MWEVISWIILGLIAGWLAAKIMGVQGQGLFLDIALGIVGAIVGGAIFQFLFNRPSPVANPGFGIGNIIVATIGSIIVLWAYHAITGRRSL